MRLEPRTDDRDAPPLGAMFGGVLVLAAGLAAVWFRLELPVPACRFRSWTGLPCPTCGSTRLVEAILSGDVLSAVAWNPLVFGCLAAVAVWALLSLARVLLKQPSWRIALSPPERLGLRVLAVLAIAAGWAYLLWRGA